MREQGAADQVQGSLADFSRALHTGEISAAALLQRYLRLRHAWPTAILLTFIAWLIPMLLGYFWFIFTLRPGILA